MEEIADHFYMITLPMPFRLKHVHVFALVHEGGVALFDTGVNSPETFSKLESSLQALGKTIENIDQIFITHFHMDHCGIAGRIKEISGATIHMSEADGQWIHHNHQEKVDISQLKEVYRQHGITDRYIEALGRLLNYFRKSTVPFHVDQYLECFETRTIGDFTFEVIPAPGHTRGQVCFFFRKEGFFLSGDHVLPENNPILSPDPYLKDFRPMRSFLDSLRRIEALPVTKVYPGHGEPFSDLKTRIREIEKGYQERKEQILASIKREPQNTLQISQVIFGSNLFAIDQFIAVNETYSYLLELKEEGLIRQERHSGHVLYVV